MYTLSKRIEIAGSHKLNLNYESPCSNIHGHNWIITVEIEGKELNPNGMLIDFKHIKDVVNVFDHTHINNKMAPLNPTAENIAFWIAVQMEEKIEPTRLPGTKVSRITVQESEDNIACYIP